MMAQSRAESTRDTCNYGQYINQFPQNTIKVIREFERIQKKIHLYIYIYTYTYIYIYIYTYIHIHGLGVEFSLLMACFHLSNKYLLFRNENNELSTIRIIPFALRNYTRGRHVLFWNWVNVERRRVVNKTDFHW